MHGYTQHLHWWLNVQLGDSLSANKLQFEVQAEMLPEACHLYSRCEAHQCGIIALRPVDTQVCPGRSLCFDSDSCFASAPMGKSKLLC